MPHLWDPSSVSPEDALARLAEGNRRFRSSTAVVAARPWDQQISTQAQRPFAIVLGCSDSRTPVEILFDQGFGDLFVVRLAGNIVAPSVIGSIEFAVSQFGTRLVVVMGHTRCGAVSATLEAMESGAALGSHNLHDIVDRISPHLSTLKGRGTSPEVVRQAVRANIVASAAHLRHGSRILEELVLAERLLIVGAEYELETGAVHFFENAPKPRV